jgi:hypothetical protein
MVKQFVLNTCSHGMGTRTVIETEEEWEMGVKTNGKASLS